MKNAICHSGNPAGIIPDPVKLIVYWIPACAGMTDFALDNRYAGMTDFALDNRYAGMTNFALDNRYAVSARRPTQASRI